MPIVMATESIYIFKNPCASNATPAHKVIIIMWLWYSGWLQCHYIKSMPRSNSIPCKRYASTSDNACVAAYNHIMLFLYSIAMHGNGLVISGHICDIRTII